MKTYPFKSLAPDGNLEADVHLPAPARRAQGSPVVIFIHGGALMMGNRKLTPRPGSLLASLLDSGFTVVSISYRLAPAVKLPEILQDVEEGCRWVRTHGPDLFSINAANCFLMGQSAGGYLTLAMGHRLEPKPAGLISFWGYGDITAPWYSQPDEFYRQQPLVTSEEAEREKGMKLYLYCRQQGRWPLVLTGLDPIKDSKAFDPFCPVRNVTEKYPATLLIHGTKDTDVPYSQSVQMAEALKAARVEHELITIADGGHGFGRNQSELAARTYAQAIQFMKKRIR
jgi:acetyl esterase/lipase